MTFEDDANGWAEERARAYGEAWVSEAPSERREYSVLREKAAFEGQRAA
jgi:hypothetical protein